MLKILFSFLFLINFYASARAAVGCSLDDPDRDVKKIFPQSTGYKTTFITLKEIGGQAVQKDIEQKLGDIFDTVYESLDVPYSYYTVLQGKETIGYIHGVNQKGKFGVLQLVIAVDVQGKILAFYYQKISSPESANFRAHTFTDQLKDLDLSDFTAFDLSGKNMQGGKVAKIADPSANSSEDFKATLRGIKKNLILLDVFLHGQKK